MSNTYPKQGSNSLMKSGKQKFYRTISGTLAIKQSNATEMAAPIYEEIQWLSPLFINFPDEKANKTIENFKEETNSKILQRFGAVDENHVPNISPDTDCKPDYYPRRQMFSINIQVIVDGRLLFLDIGSRSIPWQSHDARIL